MKLESMSKNVINIMYDLASLDGLAMLLLHNDKTPYKTAVTEAEKNGLLMTKIVPFPFDTEAETADGSFIRVYYNDGEFNTNETIAECNLHIDIIVAKSLWLINDNQGKGEIRPYSIMGRIVDRVGHRSVGSKTKVKFEGYQHLYVNTKFEAIRLYANYMSVESSR